MDPTVEPERELSIPQTSSEQFQSLDVDAYATHFPSGEKTEPNWLEFGTS